MRTYRVSGSSLWLFSIALMLAVAILVLILGSSPAPSQALAPGLQPVLDMDKEASPQRVLNGGVVTYTLTFSNSGQLTGSLQAITDTLDPSLSFLGMASGSDVMTAPHEISGTLVWTGSLEVPPQGELALRYRVETPADPGWSYPCNRAQADAEGQALGPVEACITVGPEKALISRGITLWKLAFLSINTPCSINKWFIALSRFANSVANSSAA